MADDPTTEAGWSEASRAATRRMKRALAKIDHGRRMSLIAKKWTPNSLTPEETVELETLQQACDDAMAEHDELKARYQRWRVVQIGGERLAKLLEGETDA